MKKQKVAKMVGNLLQGVAVIAGLLMMDMDLDRSGFTFRQSIVAYAQFLLIILVCAGLSYVCLHTNKIRRVVDPAVVVVFAYIGDHVAPKAKIFKSARKIRKHCKSYRNTYRMCQHACDNM